jgi:hypothetical protein
LEPAGSGEYALALAMGRGGVRGMR